MLFSGPVTILLGNPENDYILRKVHPSQIKFFVPPTDSQENAACRWPVLAQGVRVDIERVVWEGGSGEHVAGNRCALMRKTVEAHMCMRIYEEETCQRLIIIQASIEIRHLPACFSSPGWVAYVISYSSGPVDTLRCGEKAKERGAPSLADLSPVCYVDFVVRIPASRRHFNKTYILENISPNIPSMITQEYWRRWRRSYHKPAY
ncbi:hypothetical protein PR048_012908 [Dryococelus australis]|uniref:Uncharacterized protein n=1 Tax=Dryococelus australis TaxID=614101 RepID=A0ABQ9HQP9_9NEOP|nr:hypothetical protein PR048_012908 [Dryococelus australis]